MRSLRLSRANNLIISKLSIALAMTENVYKKLTCKSVRVHVQPVCFRFQSYMRSRLYMKISMISIISGYKKAQFIRAFLPQMWVRFSYYTFQKPNIEKLKLLKGRDSPIKFIFHLKTASAWYF